MSKKDPWLSLCDSLFLVSVVWTPIYWILDPFGWFPEWKYKLFLLPVILLFIRMVIKAIHGEEARSGLLEKDLFKKVTFLFAAPFLLFLGFEFVLAKLEFSAPLKPIAIKNKTAFYKDSTVPIIVDKTLIWAFNPGADFNGRKINQMGFADREVDPHKVPGSMRVICMGDSCTGQGIPPYSGFLNTKLKEGAPTDQPWESFNMGVHGYSSSQGLGLFQSRAQYLEPDYVTVYFGWNDHWRGSAPDARRMATEVKEGFRWYAVKKIREKLFYQFLVSVASKSEFKQERDAQNFVLRVAPEEYRSNLTKFVKSIRAVGAKPVLITAPRDHSLTKSLVQNRQTQSIEKAIQLHDQYNDICRAVAKEQGALLLDLAKDFEREELRQWFSGDGIHFKREGRIYIADALYELIAKDAKAQ